MTPAPPPQTMQCLPAATKGADRGTGCGVGGTDVRHMSGGISTAPPPWSLSGFARLLATLVVVPVPMRDLTAVSTVDDLAAGPAQH